MNNVMTNKTKGINIPFDEKISLVSLPSNEDFSIVVEVTAIEEQIILGKKIWDTSQEPKIFYAKNISNGYLEVGQKTIFYRVGDFNSSGLESPELHEENPNNYSFICIPVLSWVFVKDLDGGNGIKVNFLEDGTTEVDFNSPILPLKPIEPLSKFHNNNPPFVKDRIYFAQHLSNVYLVWLPGFGDEKYTPEIEINETSKIKLHCDNQGNVLDMTAEEEEPPYDFWVNDLHRWFTYIYNLDYEGAMCRIYLNTAGEELNEYKNKMLRKEVEIYSPTFATPITTMIKSQKQIGWGQLYNYPLKWDYAAYKKFGRVPTDYYTNFLARSIDPNVARSPHTFDYPGSGTYPPPGCLNDNDLVQYRCREFYTDGGTRITQKDMQNYIFYEDVAPTDNRNILFKCAGYVPFPKSNGWYRFNGADYIEIGVNRGLGGGVTVPPQYGVLNNAVYIWYLYEQTGGAPPYHYSLLRTIEAQFYEGADERGAMRVPRANNFKGVDGIIPVIYSGGAEIWCMPM